MKKFAKDISPYILLLLPIFAALIVLLLNTQYDLLREGVERHASFFSIPQFNVCEVILSFF